MHYLFSGVRGNGLMKRPSRPQIRHRRSGRRAGSLSHANNAGDVIETEL
jgi:hypothetical protein